MAAFRMIVTLRGELEAMQDGLNNRFYSGPEAADEPSAHETALEHFESDALRNDWELYPDSIESYEICNTFGELLGWSMLAEGHPLSA